MNYKQACKYWSDQIETVPTAEFFAGKIIKAKKSQRHTKPERMLKKLFRLKYGRLYERDNDKYVLKGHGIKKEPDLLEWDKWFETHPRQLKVTNMHGKRISTVFLGLDHGWHGDKPILFDTMIFGDDMLGEDTRRYATWDEAIKGHWEMVEEVKRNTVFH